MDNFLELSNLEQIHSQNPDSIIFATLASRYIELGLFDKALATAEQGAQRHPTYAFGQFILGLSNYHLNKLESARKHMELATAYDENNPRAWKILGEINQKLHQEDQATFANVKYFLLDAFNKDAVDRFQHEDMLTFNEFETESPFNLELDTADNTMTRELDQEQLAASEEEHSLESLFENGAVQDEEIDISQKVEEVFKETLGDMTIDREHNQDNENFDEEADAIDLTLLQEDTPAETEELKSDELSSALDDFFSAYETSDEENTVADEPAPTLDAAQPADPVEADDEPTIASEDADAFFRIDDVFNEEADPGASTPPPEDFSLDFPEDEESFEMTLDSEGLANLDPDTDKSIEMTLDPEALAALEQDDQEIEFTLDAEKLAELGDSANEIEITLDPEEMANLGADDDKSIEITLDPEEMANLGVDEDKSIEISLDPEEMANLGVDEDKSIEITLDPEEMANLGVDEDKSIEITLDPEEMASLGNDEDKSFEITLDPEEMASLGVDDDDKSFEITLDPEEMASLGNDEDKSFEITLDPEEMDALSGDEDKSFEITLDPEEMAAALDSDKSFEITLDPDEMAELDAADDKSFEITFDPDEVDALQVEDESVEITLDPEELSTGDDDDEDEITLDPEELADVNDTPKSFELTLDPNELDLAGVDDDKSFEITLDPQEMASIPEGDKSFEIMLDPDKLDSDEEGGEITLDPEEMADLPDDESFEITLDPEEMDGIPGEDSVEITLDPEEIAEAADEEGFEITLDPEEMADAVSLHQGFEIAEDAELSDGDVFEFDAVLDDEEEIDPDNSAAPTAPTWDADENTDLTIDETVAPPPSASNGDSEKRFGKPPIVSSTLGEIYIAQGRFEEAIDVFEQLLEQDPNNQRFEKKIEDIKGMLSRQ